MTRPAKGMCITHIPHVPTQKVSTTSPLPRRKGVHTTDTLAQTTTDTPQETAAMTTETSFEPKLPNGLPIFAYDVNDFSLAVGIGRTKIYEMIKDGRLKAGWLEGKRIIPATEAKRIVDAAMEL